MPRSLNRSYCLPSAPSVLSSPHLPGIKFFPVTAPAPKKPGVGATFPSPSPPSPPGLWFSKLHPPHPLLRPQTCHNALAKPIFVSPPATSQGGYIRGGIAHTPKPDGAGGRVSHQALPHGGSKPRPRPFAPPLRHPRRGSPHTRPGVNPPNPIHTPSPSPMTGCYGSGGPLAPHLNTVRGEGRDTHTQRGLVWAPPKPRLLSRAGRPPRGASPQSGS